MLARLRHENLCWFEPTIPGVEGAGGLGASPGRFKHGEQQQDWFELDRDYPYLAVQQYVIDNLRGALTPLHRGMRDLCAVENVCDGGSTSARCG